MLPASAAGSSDILLQALQTTVEALHDVQLPLQVNAYFIDALMRREIPGACETLPEQFFVREVEDTLEMALYIAPEIMAQLSQDDPYQRLHPGNWQNYCIALEGVSHFVFVAWRAHMGCATSALELELQAEVDKFVASWLLWRRQGIFGPHVAAQMLHQLFRAYVLREGVPPAEQARYHAASRAAATFCTHLTQNYAHLDNDRAMLQSAHAFSRRSLQAKLL